MIPDVLDRHDPRQLGLSDLFTRFVEPFARRSEPGEQTAAVDEGLSWHGITLYGIVDLGFQYDSHGAPFSDYYPAGSADIVQKNSRQSVNWNSLQLA